MSKIKTRNTTRRRHTNSKLGCQNCKRKKIRCDEQLPQCGNCIRGKRDTCSYLNLSPAEIEKIRLTHSLRDSQNKLLNQNYRLPTSTTKGQTSQNYKLSDTILEIKFELADLPIRIPSIPYPPLQFNNLSVDDFSDEFHVITESECASSTKSTPFQPKKCNKLPNAIEQVHVFHPLRNIFCKKINVEPHSGAELTYHGVSGKVSIFDFLCNCLMRLPARVDENDYILIQAYLCLGEAVLLNTFHQRMKYSKSSDNSFVSFLDKNWLERHGHCQRNLRSALADFDKISMSLSPQRMAHLGEIYSFSSYLLSFAILMMKFGAQSYFNSSKGVCACFDVYSRYIIRNNLRPISIVGFLLNNLQTNLVSISLPSYNPQFLFEIESNLRSLEFIFASPLTFGKDSIDERFRKIEFEYKSLMKFFSDVLLPIIFSSRNENVVCSYPPLVIYEVFRQWHTIIPSEAMAYKPKWDSDYPKESSFLNDLSTTLYMYYYAMAAALDAVFPACKYLYSMSFMFPTNKFFINRSVMTINKQNSYMQRLYKYRIDETVQRHIYYASRVFAFFRRRFVFYHNNIIWSNPYNESLVQNRFQSRVIATDLEVPIKSFNTTLIRPEHYPTKNDSNPNNVNNLEFIREDDTMTKKLYARNIETLSFFDESSILQYDFETMLLLRDYRPLDVFPRKRRALEVEDITQYYEDRFFILSTIT
ncbi:uncharacterized protein J8A68_004082 [[Candida] subhashii]|uniref:Zn(2)-C6 fungal-type domain-containing protein n=1 Tax=[Candida] subhashii TaxID=561895 RepID=A0A8J5UXM6_9ASCO|nr:uncharacterized protein J8A68_004082 [[Candida] subhashii]KAG7662434.1 hypothetical protein J8A68_004082 [[Candida] subhashii]